jgi:hypothetical protein
MAIARISSTNSDLTATGAHQTRGHPQNRGFAGAVRSEEAVNHACLQGKGQVLDHLSAVELSGKAESLDYHSRGSQVF